MRSFFQQSWNCFRFDIWDIMVELIAELVAVFIIKISFLEEVQEKYEKEN